MTDFFKESVKPSDFDLFHDDWQSDPVKSVARQIIIVCKKFDGWNRPFMFQEYLALADGIRHRTDQDIFVCLTMDGCLEFENGCYAITKEFIRRYAKFLKKEEIDDQP